MDEAIHCEELPLPSGEEKEVAAQLKVKNEV